MPSLKKRPPPSTTVDDVASSLRKKKAKTTNKFTESSEGSSSDSEAASPDDSADEPERYSKSVKVQKTKQQAKAKQAKKPSNAADTKSSSSGPLSKGPFRERALTSRKFVGAHVSAAGGADMAVVNCAMVQGEAFALFLKNQRRWDAPPLTENTIKAFSARCAELEFDPSAFALPHGSYLINLANPGEEKRRKSYEGLIDDLQRCHSLGITLYNLHPGSTVGECDAAEGIKNIAASINKAHLEVEDVIIVIENMSGQKNVIGSKFEDLRDIIDLTADKSRIGVCLDTAHLFAAGFDIRTAEKFDLVMKSFERIVGLPYLKAMHLNDSKAGLASGLDRHEHIGKGHIGEECFKFIMNDPRFSNIPLVLETPEETMWKDEIAMLYGMIETCTDK